MGLILLFKSLHVFKTQNPYDQETRHINAALIQHITFNEFLPMVLGKEVMHAHDLVLLKVSNSQSIQMMVSKERV